MDHNLGCSEELEEATLFRSGDGLQWVGRRHGGVPENGGTVVVVVQWIFLVT
jgi:hypothetical protein